MFRIQKFKNLISDLNSEIIKKVLILEKSVTLWKELWIQKSIGIKNYTYFEFFYFVPNKINNSKKISLFESYSEPKNFYLKFWEISISVRKRQKKPNGHVLNSQEISKLYSRNVKTLIKNIYNKFIHCQKFCIGNTFKIFYSEDLWKIPKRIKVLKQFKSRKRGYGPSA